MLLKFKNDIIFIQLFDYKIKLIFFLIIIIIIIYLNDTFFEK